MWVVLPDERADLSFILVAGPRQCSDSRVRVQPQIRDYPNLENQVPIFISPQQNRVSHFYPQPLGTVFVVSYGSQGYGGVRTPLLFPSNGCCIVACLHSSYLAMCLRVTISFSVLPTFRRNTIHRSPSYPEEGGSKFLRNIINNLLYYKYKQVSRHCRRTNVYPASYSRKQHGLTLIAWNRLEPNSPDTKHCKISTFCCVVTSCKVM
jgi:hypothetical protein